MVSIIDISRYAWIFLLAMQAMISVCFADGNVFDLADHLIAIHQFDEGITEYKRVLFFDHDDSTGSEAWYRIALSYRNLMKWNEAVDAINISADLATCDSTRDQRNLSKAVIYLSMSDFSSAEFDLLRIRQFSSTPSLQHAALLFLGMAHLYSAKWEQARSELNAYFADSPVMQIELDSLFHAESKRKHKSPRTAKWLSTFIPGSGQVYAGNVLNGANALALNSAIGLLLFNSLTEMRLLDLFLFDVPFFERYYQGNRNNAAEIAQTKNEEADRSEAQQILLFIQSKNPAHF